MNSLPATTVTNPICNVPGFIYFLLERAAGTAVIFILTFQADGAAVGSYSTFRCRPGTVIWMVFLCCRHVHGNVRCSRQILSSGLTPRCHLTINSGAFLKAGRCLIH